MPRIMVTFFIFGTVAIFRKFIPLSSALLACLRGFGGGLFLVAVSLLKGKRVLKGIGRRSGIILAVTGALIGLNWILLFEAYTFASVSTVTLAYNMQPVMVILLSPVFFKESLTGKKIICAVVAVAGIVLISGVTGTNANVLEIRGVIYGLLAAALYAAVVTINKKLPAFDANAQTTIQLLAAAVVVFPYVLMTEDFSLVTLTGCQVVLLLILCFFHTGFTYAMYFGTIGQIPAQRIAILSYIDPVTTLVLSAFLLGERMDGKGIIGALLILGASYMICTVKERE